MLPSVFAFSLPRRRQVTHHNIACGLIDILACKHCRSATRPKYRQRIDSPATPEDLNNNKEEKKCASKKKPKTGLSKSSSMSMDTLTPDVAQSKESMKRPLSCDKTIKPKRPLSATTAAAENDVSHVLDHSLSTSDLPAQARFNSILKKDMSARWCQLKCSGSTMKKQAHFSELVSVVIHDKEGKPLVHDKVKLKESAPAPEVGDSNWEKNPVWIVNKAPFKLDSLEVIEGDKSTEGYLKAIIYLGEDFASDKVELHPARMGLALAVVAYRLEPFGDGTQYYKRYSQRFSLPQPIDPYTIQAALISQGYVRIFANLLDASEEE